MSTLAQEIGKHKPFELPEEEAYLNLLRTVGLLSAEFERLFKRHGLSEATYNILRILRGAGPSGKPCGRIGREMVARVPDMTRLLDRLERQRLVERTRTADDRRVVIVRITPRGADLLAQLDPVVSSIHRSQLGHVPRRELADLSRLLVKARRKPGEEPSERD